VLSSYSSSAFGPSKLSLQVISAFELSSSDQQRLCIIRVRAPVPRIIFFGPAAPLHYSIAGASPTNYFLRASSASVLIECGCQSLELSFSGQQRLCINRVWVPVPRIVFFGPAAPQLYSCLGFGPFNSRLSAIDIFVRALVPQISVSGYQRSPLKIPKFWWQYTSSDAVCQI
jgi:hypothetical protein